MEKINKVLSAIIPAVLLILGLYLVPLSIYGDGWKFIPGDFGDARFNNYILEHNYQTLIGNVKSFWDAPFLYPLKNTIAYSDNLLGSSPIYCLFRYLGKDRELAFQWWLLSLFILNYLTAFWVMRKWTGDGILAGVGAYVFSFSLMLVGNIYNVQTLPRFILPFIFYWFWICLKEKDNRYFLYGMLGLVYQFYCGIYLGFLATYSLLFFFISYFIVYRDSYFFNQFRTPRIWHQHMYYLLITIVLFYPLIHPYLEISKVTPPDPFEFTFLTIPTPYSYFFTSDASIPWAFLYNPQTEHFKFFWCHFLFIGALPWLAFFISPFLMFSGKTDKDSSRFLKFLMFSLALSMVFCLNLNGFSLYKWLWYLPGFSSMRSMNRLINIELLLFSFILVYVFHLLKRKSKNFVFMSFLLPILVLADNWMDTSKIMRYDVQSSKSEIGKVKSVIQTQYDPGYKAIAVLSKKQEHAVDFHLNVMLAAQELNIACVNAYTGHFPGSYNGFFSVPSDSCLNSWCYDLGIDRSRIQTIDLDNSISSQKVSLKANNGMFLCADQNHQPKLFANRIDAYDWETFKLMKDENGLVFLQSSLNKFFCAEQGGGGELTVSRDYPGEWEKFKMIPLPENKIAFQSANGHYMSLDNATTQISFSASKIGANESFEIKP